MLGTIILWILAIVGALALLLWAYAWLTADKEIEKAKRKGKKH